MPYPYVFTSLTAPNNSYADIPQVQALILSFQLSNDGVASVHQIQTWLVNVTNEIDSVLLKAGVQVPPPVGTAIVPILVQTCATGAAALLAYARYETGDETLGSHANALMNAYDAQLGLLERGDIPLLLMGMISAGWAVTDDRRQYYASGNIVLDRTGNPKTPIFTAQDQW